jgi:drug/metabolite transporter (DMT)-like permease
MRAGDVARLVVLAAIWGASFIFLRVAAPVLGPVLTALLRVLIAGIALLGYLQVRGLGYGNVGRYWREYLVIGVANSAIPFLLFSFAALYLPASYSAILNSATPLFGALLSTIWLAEPLTALKLIGLFAGAAGVALVSGAGPVVPDAMIGWAVAACLIAALCYAGAGIYVKKRLAGATPLAMATWSQIFAALAMLPLVPFAPPRAGDHRIGHRQRAGACVAVERGCVLAVLSTDRRRRTNARDDRRFPAAAVWNAVGRVVSR